MKIDLEIWEGANLVCACECALDDNGLRFPSLLLPVPRARIKKHIKSHLTHTWGAFEHGEYRVEYRLRKEGFWKIRLYAAGFIAGLVVLCFLLVS